ncbi:hypothetical protein V8D89_009023 [Ganoderma adspersum]
MSARTTRNHACTESQEIVKQDPKAEMTSTSAPHTSDSNLQHTDHGRDIKVEHDRPGGGRRDPEFWFSDGTVILVAKDVKFRIYRGLLGRVLSCIQGDVRSGRMSIPPEHSLFFKGTKPSFHQISTYIRLGQKYKLDELYEQSRQFLKNHYTNDLGTWDEHTTWEPPGWPGNHSIGVVNLAWLINELSLLPTALLAYIYMDAVIMQGFRREDGTREMLALDDLRRCFQASKDIREAHASPAPCSCSAALHLALWTLEARMDWLMSSGPFLKFDELLQDMPVELDRMCAACTTMVKERHKKEREAFWVQLPELLDIEVPGWGAAIPQGEAAS